MDGYKNSSIAAKTFVINCLLAERRIIKMNGDQFNFVSGKDAKELPRNGA